MKKMAADKFVELFIRRSNTSTEKRSSTPVDDLKGWAEKAAGEALEVVATFQEKDGVTPEKAAEVAAAAGEALLTRALEIKHS
jgi:class 3 adenylate cyclase